MDGGDCDVVWSLEAVFFMKIRVFEKKTLFIEKKNGVFLLAFLSCLLESCVFSYGNLYLFNEVFIQNPVFL